MISPVTTARPPSPATGRPTMITAEHVGAIVADVADVAEEWATRHGRPCGLTLTNPAGGRREWDGAGPEYEVDAIQICRILAGRGTGEGLLDTNVPF